MSFRYEIFFKDMMGVNRVIFHGVTFYETMKKLQYYRSLRPRTNYWIEMCF